MKKHGILACWIGNGMMDGWKKTDMCYDLLVGYDGDLIRFF